MERLYRLYLRDGEKPVDDKKANKWKGWHLKANSEDYQDDTHDLKNKELIEEILDPGPFLFIVCRRLSPFVTVLIHLTILCSLYLV